MTRARSIHWGITTLAGLLLCGSASAKEALDTSTEKWRVELTPLIWLPSIAGDAQAGPIETSVDVSFDDTIAHLDFAFMMHAEVGKGKWSVLFDGLYLDVDSESFGRRIPFEINGDVKTYLIDLSGAYRFAEFPLSGGATPRLGLDGILGGRYIHLGVKLDPERFQSSEETVDLFDPYFGARAVLQFTDRFSASLKGTIGGFGIGTELSWTAALSFDYRMTDHLSMLFGYNALGLDVEDGSGLNRFNFDAVFHGPFVGLTFRF